MARMKPDQQKQAQGRSNRCVTTIIKPLRIFQFFVILLLFAFVIYIIVTDPMPMSTLACILLIVLSGAYVFVLAVDLISQFAGGALHVIPMFAFSMLGVLLFATAGTLLIVNGYTELAVQIATLTLCLLAALLFLIDVTMILTFWRKRCTVCKRCCGNGVAELCRKELRPAEGEIIKYDVTTSVSDIRVPPELQDLVAPDHTYRKLQYGLRREYVDRATSVPSLLYFDVAQVQTDAKKITVMESQTPSAIVKETPIQTVSRCDLCNRQLQLFEASGMEAAAAGQCIQQLPQWGTCPAILQFVRGGISVPCCPGCKCVTGTQQGQQQPSLPTPERPKSLIQTGKPNNGSLTSETTQQVANSVYEISNDTTTRLTEVPENNTKRTLASNNAKPNRRNRTLSKLYARNTSNFDTTKVKEKPDQKPIQDTNVKLAKRNKKEETEKVRIIVEPVKETTIISMEEIPASNTAAKNDKELFRDTNSNTERKLERTNEKMQSSAVTRNEGMEKEGAAISQRFENVTEENRTTNREESPEYATNATSSTTPSSSRRKSRLLLHVKSNKVDPIDDADGMSNEARIGGGIENDTPKASYDSPITITQGDESARSAEIYDVCSQCKRQRPSNATSFISSPDSSRYQNIFKDKKGRYFCENCAPPGCKRMTNRMEIKYVKRLRCAICSFSLLGPGSNVLLGPDVCSKCGQPQ